MRIARCCAWFAGLLLLPVAASHAGLLAEHTRIIYPDGSSGRSLRIANTNAWPVLVQTWVDRGEGDINTADAPFVAVPAIFRLEPGATRSLRILHTGAALPASQESLFWLNLYEIPPTAPAADPDTPLLTLTLTTQIKLFYRPHGIGAPAALAQQLAFRLDNRSDDDSGTHPACLLASNPSPWHATFSALDVDGTDDGLLSATAADILPPFSTARYCLQPGQPATDPAVHFSLINDAGASQTGHQRLAD